MYIHQAKQFARVILTVLFLLGAGMAEAQKVRVTEVVPAESEEDVVNLDVEISGGGFDEGSEATFFVAGSTTNKGGVKVNHTGLINSKKVIVNIDIPLGSTLGDYDVEVSSLRGRRGKGNSLFRVLQKGTGSGDAPGGNPNSESSGKIFPVKVEFDDLSGDTIKGDDVFIDSVNVAAEVPVEGSPPGQFMMWQGVGKNPSSTLFFDFGPAVDCNSGDPSSTGGCVTDSNDDDVLCPFKPGDRNLEDGSDDDSQCSGSKGVLLHFRHTVDNDGNPASFMLGMVNDTTFPGKAAGAEISFQAEKKSDWRLRFDPLCLGYGVGEFLQIEAHDNVTNDDLPNDYWHIGTGAGSKIACLTKIGKGQAEDLIGLFDMRFGYSICILVDPDAGDGDCLEP